MAKPKKKRKARSFTIPVAAVAGIAGSLYQPVEAVMAGQPLIAFERFIRGFTGFSPKNKDFVPARLLLGWGPLLLGVGGSVAASKLGLNKKLGSARVPFFRI